MRSTNKKLNSSTNKIINKNVPVSGKKEGVGKAFRNLWNKFSNNVKKKLGVGRVSKLSKAEKAGKKTDIVKMVVAGIALLTALGIVAFVIANPFTIGILAVAALVFTALTVSYFVSHRATRLMDSARIRVNELVDNATKEGGPPGPIRKLVDATTNTFNKVGETFAKVDDAVNRVVEGCADIKKQMDDNKIIEKTASTFEHASEFGDKAKKFFKTEKARSIGKRLDGMLDDLKATTSGFSKMSTLVSDLGYTSKDVKATVEDTREMLRNFKTTSKNVSSFTSNLNETMGKEKLQRIMNNIEGSTQEMKSVFEEAAYLFSPYSEERERFNSLLKQAEETTTRITENINKGLDDNPEFTKDLMARIAKTAEGFEKSSIRMKALMKTSKKVAGNVGEAMDRERLQSIMRNVEDATLGMSAVLTDIANVTAPGSRERDLFDRTLSHIESVASQVKEAFDANPKFVENFMARVTSITGTLDKTISTIKGIAKDLDEVMSKEQLQGIVNNVQHSTQEMITVLGDISSITSPFSKERVLLNNLLKQVEGTTVRITEHINKGFDKDPEFIEKLMARITKTAEVFEETSTRMKAVTKIAGKVAGNVGEALTKERVAGIMRNVEGATQEAATMLRDISNITAPHSKERVLFDRTLSHVESVTSQIKAAFDANPKFVENFMARVTSITGTLDKTISTIKGIAKDLDEVMSKEQLQGIVNNVQHSTQEMITVLGDISSITSPFSKERVLLNNLLKQVEGTTVRITEHINKGFDKDPEFIEKLMARITKTAEVFEETSTRMKAVTKIAGKVAGNVGEALTKERVAGIMRNVEGATQEAATMLRDISNITAPHSKGRVLLDSMLKQFEATATGIKESLLGVGGVVPSRNVGDSISGLTSTTADVLKSSSRSESTADNDGMLGNLQDILKKVSKEVTNAPSENSKLKLDGVERTKNVLVSLDSIFATFKDMREIEKSRTKTNELNKKIDNIVKKDEALANIVRRIVRRGKFTNSGNSVSNKISAVLEGLEIRLQEINLLKKDYKGASELNEFIDKTTKECCTTFAKYNRDLSEEDVLLKVNSLAGYFIGENERLQNSNSGIGGLMKRMNDLTKAFLNIANAAQNYEPSRVAKIFFRQGGNK